MKELRFSTRARKDLRKYRSDIRKMRLLYEALSLLANDIRLPSKFKAHPLSGDYKDCMECHIGSDFLLIWLDAGQKRIDVLRIGTHSELFGKRFR